MDQIEEVRKKTDIVELINSYIPLKRAGRNFKALCPFHSEKTPSFIVSPERQIWKCFGCGLGGDVFKFLVEYEKMTFGEALRFLAEKAGIKLIKIKPSSDQLEKEKLLAINHLASEFFHFVLLHLPVGERGRRYLLERGINKNSIQFFKLGYAPQGWDNLFNYLVKKKNYQPQELEKTGLVIKKISREKNNKVSWYDRFRGRIIFPLMDHRGNILGFAGRTLFPDLKGAKYINTPETAIYHKGELLYGLFQNKEEIKKKNKAVIVEGEIDLISSWQAGVKNVVAIKGSVLTEDQVNLLKRFTNNIVLALDADAAGDAAVRRGIEIADNAGLNIRIVQPKYGKDPDECCRYSPSLWRESVKDSIPIFDFYIKSAVERFGLETPEGRKKISEEVIPLLNKITNEVIKAYYFKKIGEILEVDEEVIIRESERLKKREKIREIPTKGLEIVKKEEDIKSRREKIEEFILSLILQRQVKIKELLESLEEFYFSSEGLKKIFIYLKKFNYKKGEKFNINEFIRSLPSELVETADRLYLQDLEDFLKDREKFLQIFKKSVLELKKIYLREELRKISQKIREKEKKKVKKGLNELRKEFALLSKNLKELN